MRSTSRRSPARSTRSSNEACSARRREPRPQRAGVPRVRARPLCPSAQPLVTEMHGLERRDAPTRAGDTATRLSSGAAQRITPYFCLRRERVACPTPARRLLHRHSSHGPPTSAPGARQQRPVDRPSRPWTFESARSVSGTSISLLRQPSLLQIAGAWIGPRAAESDPGSERSRKRRGRRRRRVQALEIVPRRWPAQPVFERTGAPAIWLSSNDLCLFADCRVSSTSIASSWAGDTSPMPGSAALARRRVAQ